MDIRTQTCCCKTLQRIKTPVIHGYLSHTCTHCMYYYASTDISYSLNISNPHNGIVRGCSSTDVHSHSTIPERKTKLITKRKNEPESLCFYVTRGAVLRLANKTLSKQMTQGTAIGSARVKRRIQQTLTLILDTVLHLSGVASHQMNISEWWCSVDIAVMLSKTAAWLLVGTMCVYIWVIHLLRTIELCENSLQPVEMCNFLSGNSCIKSLSLILFIQCLSSFI